MMTFLLIIHSLVCILLLAVVLMQAGRGGGLTEQFSSAENVFGAQTNTFMVRTTSVLATVFFTTCLLLAFLSARQERSLVAERSVARKTAAVKPAVPANVAVPAVPQTPSMPVTSEPAAQAPEAPETQMPVTANAQ